MIILVKNIRLSLDYRDEDILKRLRRELKFAPDCKPAWRFRRRSLDARRKNDLHFLADVEVDLPWRQSYAANANLAQVMQETERAAHSRAEANKTLAGFTVSAEQVSETAVSRIYLSPDSNNIVSAGQEKQTVVSAGKGNQMATSAGQVRPTATSIDQKSQQHSKLRPLVVGAGPAGLFAAWALACEGFPPIILERGPELSERIRKVEDFRRGGPFDPEANIPFGEGGAGTFSDGKLLSRIKDPRAALVPRIFALCGAPEEILWEQKPHIGTDRLRAVLYKMRQKLIQMGVEFRFNCRVDGLWIESPGAAEKQTCIAAPACTEALVGTAAKKLNGNLPEGSTEDGSEKTTFKRPFQNAGKGLRKLLGVSVGAEKMAASTVIFACGHSADDSARMLRAAGLKLENKAFAVGFRIEHPQKLINLAQYGKFAEHPRLGAADYRLSWQSKSGRGVFTFCMCPGGEVVASNARPKSIVTNGMSAYARAEENANSALICQVSREDFGEEALAGLSFQEELEGKAYFLGQEGASEVDLKVVTADHIRGVHAQNTKEITADDSSKAIANVAKAAAEDCTPKATGDDGVKLISDYAKEAAENSDKETLLDYAAPVQEVGDFINAVLSRYPEAKAELDDVLVRVQHINAALPAELRRAQPSYKPLVRQADLSGLYPREITLALCEALLHMGTKLQGFAASQAVLTAAETRSSSALRILRNSESLESVELPGFYPCGEGAGYAGGITSAAVDGLRVAEKIIARLRG